MSFKKFEPNDIILKINGFLVDSVAKALRLMEVLQSEREITLKVEREGKPVQFHYYIDWLSVQKIAQKKAYFVECSSNGRKQFVKLNSVLAALSWIPFC